MAIREHDDMELMAIRSTGKHRMIAPRSRIRRLLALPAREIALGAEALLFLALARMLLLLPFARVMRLLGLKAGESSFAAAHAEDTASGILHDIRIAILRAGHAAPFRAACLPQAVAAGLMLRRRRQTLEIHFGVIREADGAVSAHAWTCCAGCVITGMEGMAGHVPIATFATGGA